MTPGHAITEQKFPRTFRDAKCKGFLLKRAAEWIAYTFERDHGPCMQILYRLNRASSRNNYPSLSLSLHSLPYSLLPNASLFYTFVFDRPRLKNHVSRK